MIMPVINQIEDELRDIVEESDDGPTPMRVRRATQSEHDL